MLCQRWGCPPSVVLREDGPYVMRMLMLLELGKPEKPKEPDAW